MYCGRCGAYVADDLNFCENCGKPMKKAVPVQVPAVQVQMPAHVPMQKKKAPVWLFVLLGVVLLGCAVLGASLLFAGDGDYTYTFSDPAKYFAENDVYGTEIYLVTRKDYEDIILTVYDTNFDGVSAANFAMEHHIVPFYEGQGFKLVEIEVYDIQTCYYLRYGGQDADFLPPAYDVGNDSHLKFTITDKGDGTIALGVAWSVDLSMEPFDASAQAKDESCALFSFF